MVASREELMHFEDGIDGGALRRGPTDLHKRRVGCFFRQYLDDLGHCGTPARMASITGWAQPNSVSMTFVLSSSDIEASVNI